MEPQAPDRHVLASFDISAPSPGAAETVVRLDSGPRLEVSPVVLDELIDLLADALLADVLGSRNEKSRVA